MKIMRTKVFVGDLKAVVGEADYDQFDQNSRHAMGFSESWGREGGQLRRANLSFPPTLAPPVGDAPVAYARWRAVTAASINPPEPGAPPDPRAVLVIDRLLVLQNYRRRGFGKAILQVALQDAAQYVVSVPVAKLALFVPSRPEFAPVAHLCLGLGLAGTMQHACDPTGLWPADQPVYEFAVSAEVVANHLRQLQALAAAQAAAAAGGSAQPAAR